MSSNQAQAILFGLALGDALGWPVEFMPLESIREMYGAAGITQPPDPALYTDDTQMTLALAYALISDGAKDIDSLMGAVGSRFIEWMHSPQNNRAPGNTCLAGTANFERGMSWREAGILSSKGCGSAMRVAPIGYVYQHDPARLKDIAIASSMITHRHPAALAASAGAAYLVKLALDGTHPRTWLEAAYTFTEGMAEDYDQALLRIGHVEGWTDMDAALKHLGQGWTADEAVAMSLYCLRRYPDDYVAAVRLAANITGDSDSVACIVGGISAAHLGMAAIPADWVARCENRAHLLDVGEQLSQVKARL